MNKEPSTRQHLPGIWVSFDLDVDAPIPPFFTYLPLSSLWIKPEIIIDKKNDWFLGIDELMENKNAN